MQARFWIYANGSLVKIKVNDGQQLSWNSYTRTDEGYDAQHESFLIDNGYVLRQWSSDGRDCDGRLSRYGTLLCHVSALSDRDCGDEVRLPDWKTIEESQCDEYAEAMNY